jgi:hypothetical protein
MIATTIISSIRVKPFCSVLIGYSFSFLVVKAVAYRDLPAFYATPMPAHAIV